MRWIFYFWVGREWREFLPVSGGLISSWTRQTAMIWEIVQMKNIQRHDFFPTWDALEEVLNAACDIWQSRNQLWSFRILFYLKIVVFYQAITLKSQHLWSIWAYDGTENWTNYLNSHDSFTYTFIPMQNFGEKWNENNLPKIWKICLRNSKAVDAKFLANYGLHFLLDIILVIVRNNQIDWMYASI